MAGLSGRAIRVAARSQPFRRAGFLFTTEAKEIAVEELGSEPLDALRRVILIGQEPELIVHLVDAYGEQVLLGSAEIADMRFRLADLEEKRARDAINLLIEDMTKPGAIFRVRVWPTAENLPLSAEALGLLPSHLDGLLDLAKHPGVEVTFIDGTENGRILDTETVAAISAAIPELQTPGGADAETDGAAALSGDAGASGGGANSEPASSITTPAGADSAPAALTEQARQQAGDDAADRKASTPEGQQPGETVEPPVAGTKKRPRS